MTDREDQRLQVFDTFCRFVLPHVPMNAASTTPDDLGSKRAVQANIEIMRAFVRLHHAPLERMERAPPSGSWRINGCHLARLAGQTT